MSSNPFNFVNAQGRISERAEWAAAQGPLGAAQILITLFKYIKTKGNMYIFKVRSHNYYIGPVLAIFILDNAMS